MNISRIVSVATRLCEAGHYAAPQIQQISGQLDQDWKSFASALEERSAILAMSSVFHQTSEQVMTGLFVHLLFIRINLSKSDFRFLDTPLSDFKVPLLWALFYYFKGS